MTRMNTLKVSPEISSYAKGLGRMDRPVGPSQVVNLGWNLLDEDLSLPTAVLYEEKIAHNLAWMQQFVNAYGAKFAPHGKTTMAPKLFQRQLEAGAWGITVATAQQALLAHEHGVNRILMANQLVGQQNLAIVSEILEDPSVHFFCLVDSAENVQQLNKLFRARGQTLQVLLEIGVDGGRAGIRSQEQLRDVAVALRAAGPQVLLCGVELFEGILSDESEIRKFLDRAVEATAELAKGEHFSRSPIILSGAGSAWFDVVAETFSTANVGAPIEIILRSGCYLTHDVGVYREAHTRIVQRNKVAHEMQSTLTPALQLWAYVHSIPEKRRAIIGLGKRDAAFDSGLPTPSLHYRPGSSLPVDLSPEWKLVKMMDQHAYLEMPEGAGLRVGDMLGFDISHPCLTFDKWRYLPVLDSEYRVIDVVETFF